MPNDRVAELYKLEYEKAAERYQEIYRSMWSIFSYLTAISAALLAFGADKVNSDALVALALVPLVFWYWTTYLPLDRYGTNVVVRLAAIEQKLSGRWAQEPQLQHFRDLAKGREKDHPGVVGKLWVACTLPRGQRMTQICAQCRRARFSLAVFFLVVHVVLVLYGVRFFASGKAFLAERSESKPATHVSATTINMR